MTSLWLDGREPSVVPPDSDRRDFDSLVVGGGITGLSTAVMLARRGQDVAVIEASFPGSRATGNSTGKVSVLQGTRLSTIARHHPDSLVAAYALANVDGQSWLLDFCRSAGVAVEAQPAITYAPSPESTAAVLAEYTVARRIGLDLEWRESAALPFPTYGAAVMHGQFQVDPVELVDALLAELLVLGVTVRTGVTANGLRATDPVVLSTTAGEFRASAVVAATGTPFLDRGLYFAKTEARRSYAQAFEPDGDLPQGMFLSATVPGSTEPTRSLRSATVADRRYLLVGGNGHVVGRHPSPALLAADLEHWTYRHFPGTRMTHSWSAQDYHSDDEIPFVGLMPRGRGRVWFATGYDKWGMTNGPAAALRIVGEILGDEPLRWARVIGRRMTVPADIAEGISAGVSVASSAIAGWADARFRRPVRPGEGHGQVTRGAIATSTIDGVDCSVSAICPHLGGIVSWNDGERSWDCPLHGSRFRATGERIEGPATTGLAPLAD